MIEHVMPLVLTISWVYTVAMLVQSIVHEKELRLKEVSLVSTLLEILVSSDEVSKLEYSILDEPESKE